MPQEHDDLTLLIECGNAIESAGVKSLLEGEGIPYVVQGEQHAAMIGGILGNTIVLPRILVAERDLSRAQALLAARPVLEGTAPSDESLEGALCPVHEAPAVATCGRCGTFLCQKCNSLGNPPLCEDCLSRDEKESAKPTKERDRTKYLVAAISLGLVVLVWALRMGCQQ